MNNSAFDHCTLQILIHRQQDTMTSSDVTMTEIEVAIDAVTQSKGGANFVDLSYSGWRSFVACQACPNCVLAVERLCAEGILLALLALLVVMGERRSGDEVWLAEELGALAPIGRRLRRGLSLTYQ